MARENIRIYQEMNMMEISKIIKSMGLAK